MRMVGQSKRAGVRAKGNGARPWDQTGEGGDSLKRSEFLRTFGWTLVAGAAVLLSSCGRKKGDEEEIDADDQKDEEELSNMAGDAEEEQYEDD